MIRLTLDTVGFPEVKDALKRVEEQVKYDTTDGIFAATTDFAKNYWQPEMPIVTGFMHDSVATLAQGKNSAIAFTQTFKKKPKGYAIFPEFRGQRPGFTKKAIANFSKNYEVQLINRLRKAIKR